MKKITAIALLLLGIHGLLAQDNTTWLDVSPQQTIHGLFEENLSPWDIFFIYPLPQAPPPTTAAETDGNHLYITGWNSEVMHKWDMLGNLLQTFTIDSIDDIRDLAYDGQYYYGASPLGISNIYVLDFDNQVCVDTIKVPYGCRSLAYNDDDSVFYSNNWSSDIIVFKHDGTIVDTLPVSNHLYGSYYGLAYDNWSPGGPYLWAFSQDGPNQATLIQLELPSGEETGFYKDLSYLSYGLAGGLFTYPDYDSSIAVIGGVMQNESLFGLELAPLSPPPDPMFAVSFHHALLIDSSNVRLSWAPAKNYLLNEYFDGSSFPPPGWVSESAGGDDGWRGYYPHYLFWPVPDMDSRYALAFEDVLNPDNSQDYLISPAFELEGQYDYFLRFESYYDGSNNHSAYVKYSLDDGLTWSLLQTMVPDSGAWKNIRIDLSPLPDGQPVKIAFHSDDNSGIGSGWAINNVMIYTDDIAVDVLGYNVYRDGLKINTALLSDTAFTDLSLPGGEYSYYIEAVYEEGNISSGEIAFHVPHYPPPPPGPECNPPYDLDAEVVNKNIHISWQEPTGAITESNPWDLQFRHTLSGEDEAGLTCDGNYFNTTHMQDFGFGRYDLSGQYLGEVSNSVYSSRNLEYTGSTGMTYVTYGNNIIDIIKLPEGINNGSLELDDKVQAIAYDEDLDAFYVNYGSSDILLIDRESGSVLSSFICRTHGNYFDFAYDNWSEGGPFLWGFSQDGPGGLTIVQISLPGGLETGFTYDASWLSNNDNGKPGGLFIMEDIVPGTVSLCGIIQGEVFFGLELGPALWDFLLGGYDVFMDNAKINSEPVTDTNYIIPDPGPGTYNLEVSAIYADSAGNFLCQSDRAGPVEVLLSDVFILGGNILTGAYKLDAGEVNLYGFEGTTIQDQLTTTVDDFGYYFFPEMVPGYYMAHAKPLDYSTFFNSHAPTYNSGKLHWEDVTPVYFDGNTYTNDILLQEIIGTGGGNGSINGNVHDLQLGSALSDAQIMLLSTAGECVALRYTNSEGNFHFGDLQLGTYGLLAEITGKLMDPVLITLSETKPDISGIDLQVSDEEIVMGMEDGLPSWINYISEAFPNPARDRVQIKIHLKENAQLHVKVHNISGQPVKKEYFHLRPGLNVVELNVHRLESGVYYLKLELDGRYSATRKLVVRSD